MNKLIYKIGASFRSPSIDYCYRFLKKTESWSYDELQDYQLEKLIDLINHAYLNSSYYRGLFDKNNLNPMDIKSLNDLYKIPITSKEQLILNTNEIEIVDSSKKYFLASTSGSTGESLQFKRNEFADSFTRAAIMRGYSWYNVYPWERNGYFWGFNFTFSAKLKTTFLDIIQNRFRLFDYQNKSIKSFIKKLKKASYIHGYSSMIYETAKIVNQQYLPKPQNLKMIKGTSEKIYDSYQEEVKKAYGLNIISEYGAAETGIIAFECPEGNMHINMEGVIVEEIDNEIIVTNLQMHSFPIIRYRLGDYIKLSDKKCFCGMHHKIIEEVTGRIGDLVYGKEQQYPSLYFYYIFKNLAKNQSLFLTYQVVQKAKGELIFLIEQELSFEEKENLEKEIKVYFKNDIHFIINENQVIKSTDKKLKSFISTINE